MQWFIYVYFYIFIQKILFLEGWNEPTFLIHCTPNRRHSAVSETEPLRHSLYFQGNNFRRELMGVILIRIFKTDIHTSKHTCFKKSCGYCTSRLPLQESDSRWDPQAFTELSFMPDSAPAPPTLPTGVKHRRSALTCRKHVWHLCSFFYPKAP